MSTRPDPESSSSALDALSARTLADYEAKAEAFWRGTRDHDVSQNIAALLRHIAGAPPFRILDFGCGPGRDLMALTGLGHVAVGLDGSPSFVAMARRASGCEAWRQDFLHLDLPARSFDGIFANATLQHVPTPALPRVLTQLRAALRPEGVLFSSIPRGQGEEGWNNGRYSVYHEVQTWRRHLAAAGFTELEHYYRPAGLPRTEQPWFASVWRAATQPAER